MDKELLAQARIAKYGTRKCSRCEKLLEYEEDPSYWHDLCGEHWNAIHKDLAKKLKGVTLYTIGVSIPKDNGERETLQTQVEFPVDNVNEHPDHLIEAQRILFSLLQQLDIETWIWCGPVGAVDDSK